MLNLTAFSSQHYFWPKKRKQALKIERVFDARGCHSRKNDGLEEKEKEKKTNPENNILFNIITSRQKI